MAQILGRGLPQRRKPLLHRLGNCTQRSLSSHFAQVCGTDEAAALNPFESRVIHNQQLRQ